MKKEQSVLVLFCSNMKTMEGRYRFAPLLMREAASKHAPRATCLKAGRPAVFSAPQASWALQSSPWT